MGSKPRRRGYELVTIMKGVLLCIYQRSRYWTDITESVTLTIC
jgi:hypothetical protein